MNVTTTSKKTTTKKTSATTTLKPSVTTTVKRNVTTTTPSPANIPKFFVCRDTNSSAATGILLPYRNTTSGKTKNCKFSIVAPPDQQIQITCSTINIIDYPSYFRIAEYADYGSEVIVNRDYFSINNSLSVTASFDYPDWFECKWTTLPKDNTTNFKLCRHAEAKTTNGIIQPLGGDTTPDRICSITIVAPSDYQIEFSCSSLNFSGYLLIENVLDGSANSAKGGNLKYNSRSTYVEVLGRKYYSINNRMTVKSSFGYQARFNCSYRAIPKEITTESKFCRHAEATAANGTISPIAGDTRYVRNCAFHIKAAPYQQIRIICSAILLTVSDSYLSIYGINEDTVGNGRLPVVNRTYYSTSYNDVTLKSYFGKNDWISCQWTTTTRENTTSLQICRDSLIGSPGMTNGTIEPLAQMNTVEQRSCLATISAPDGYQIQLSCSAVNMSSDSYFRILGTIDEETHPSQELNRVYTSSLSNKIMIYSVFSQSDWFYCKWNIALREIPQNSKLCLHAESTVANGTITPLAGNTGPMRECPFVIKGLPDQMLQISCSTLNFSTPDGYLKISGIIDYPFSEDYAIVNRMYTAITNNEINIYSIVGNEDWIECKWTTTPMKNTTDFKLCRDEVATSSSGTIQPLVGDTGPKRDCYFSIQTTSSDQQIQMSCSAIKFNSSDSYLYIDGAVDYPLKLVLNRIYSSSYEISFDSGMARGDWIDCKWNKTTVKNTTDYKFCRDSAARTANGTIQPLTGDPGPLRECLFSIYAFPSQQIRISCSTLNLTSPGSYFTISGIIGTANPLLLNRVYYSSYLNQIELQSGINKGNWIDCKWTTTPVEITLNSKLCRHQRATTPNGTITPLGMTLGEPKRECDFTIKANLDQQIQFYCSAVRLSSGSYLNLYGMIGQSETDSAVTLNRVYYSTRSNDLRLSSKIGSSDTFNCTWATIPLEITSQFKLCRHAEATAANGTITPITGDKRSCFFLIKAYPNQKIQISCSVLKLTSTGSYLSIKGLVKGANPPVLNQVYTSTVSNDITLSSSFDKFDKFNCSWTITTRY
ncbi:uncharacterized protein LOC124326050 [Daphnia pulicaria]|uniref:uncharacterized protein LOC124326050 n=1 Tax=Daphnia pulicaria TaxID=35523 RepID=UPI001EEB1DD7|nr:uncharacterized protein LOC124326050 [Daphnia pulicaria]